MLRQGDFPHELTQVIRSVNKHVSPKSYSPTSPDKIHYVGIQLDPNTQTEFILWDDIVQVFENAVKARHKKKVVPFLRGKNCKKYV